MCSCVVYLGVSVYLQCVWVCILCAFLCCVSIVCMCLCPVSVCANVQKDAVDGYVCVVVMGHV